MKKFIWIIIIIFVLALVYFVIPTKEKEQFVPLSEYNQWFHNPEG